MAIQITRLYEPDTTTINRGGSNSATIVYRVWDDAGLGVTKEQTYTLAGLPQTGQPHPEIGNAVAQSITRQQSGRAVLVTVSYAPVSGGSTQRPIVDILEANFSSMEISSQDITVEVPAFRLKRAAFEGDTPGTIQDQFYWERLEPAFQVEVNRHTFTVVVSGESLAQGTIDNLFSAFTTIRAQQNTLHTFNGEQYLFKPRFIKQRTKAQDAAAGQPAEPTRWEVQYTWLFDPGIRNTYGPGGAPGAFANGLHFRNPVTVGGLPLFTHAYVCQDLIFAVRPYQNVQTYPNIDDPQQPPVIDFLTPYRSVPTGWQNLPGIAPPGP